MVRVETIRRRVSEIILPPFNDLPSLYASCEAASPLVPDSTLRMCLGLNKTPVGKGHMINGQFGIKKVDIHTGEDVALCGFDVEKGEMVIRHTPQGNRPDKFSSESVRHRLGRSNFRLEMMQAMVDIAKRLGLKAVVGFPVRPNLIGLQGNYEKKVRAKNTLFEAFDFSLKNHDQPNEAYYYLPL